jgi:hypothetical protein
MAEATENKEHNDLTGGGNVARANMGFHIGCGISQQSRQAREVFAQTARSKSAFGKDEQISDAILGNAGTQASGGQCPVKPASDSLPSENSESDKGEGSDKALRCTMTGSTVRYATANEILSALKREEENEKQ